MKKILIVDDQPDNVFILEDRLKREGFETISAYDGPTCLQKAEDDNPDLVLLDVMMPGMSGFEACEKLVSNEKTKSIPVILVTALTDIEDIKKGLSVGAFDYIKKPYNRAELIARVNSALRFSESNKVLIEVEKIKTFAATVITANHEIKQPLTLINLSTAAITRELGREELRKEVIQKRIMFIDNATKDIIRVLEKFNQIKKPVITDYVNNLKMVDLDKSEE
ncbi:MAG: response regulator [Ignavibacteriae bacterium HGW-Ignavibacteriae-2]|jgi:two-component system cell cycle response regulator|nr:response regulator [Bacteroidota bacterium]PKL90043.1 MAG: response regulator [Ignavibacteriae bacterium HGW-Ignavibacteriae-2]